MTHSNESDYALIVACRAGDIGAWERLLDSYDRLVFSIPRSYGLSDDDAADVVQLTFTILLQSLDILREDSRLGAWLATVARRHTWRVVARNRREGLPLEATEQLPDGTDMYASVDRSEQAEWVQQGLIRLDTRCRNLLVALYFEDPAPTYIEVADRIGVPVGSVGPTRARCLQRLKQLLQHSE